MDFFFFLSLNVVFVCRRIFGRTSEGSLKRIQDDLESDEEESSPPLKKQSKASDYLISVSIRRK